MVVTPEKEQSENSFCILEVQIKTFLCNIKCTYCDIGRAGNRRSELAIRNETDGVLDTVRNHISNVTNAADFPLLKLIGGEVFVIPGFAEFASDLACNFETVLITTNATLLARQLDTLGQMPNLVLQVSLDGHNVEMNRHRFTSPDQLDTIFANIQRALSLGIRVELNCVVSSNNVGHLPEFCEFLQREYPGQITLQPFPVRWRRGEVWNDEKSAHEFKILIDEHERFSDVLPPISYLRLVRDFLSTGRRSAKCWFPRVYVGLTDDGSLRMCNCLPVKEFSIADADSRPLGDLWQETKGMKRLERGKRLSGMCNTCVDQFDLLTLALQGKVDVETLTMFPSYSGPRFQANLKKARERFFG